MDQVAICNLALGWLGANAIHTIDDATTGASLCKANWDAVRDAVLEAHAWTWAIQREEIAADGSAPTYGWDYRYLVPSAAIRVLEATNSAGTADFEWEREGQFILTDQVAPLYVRYVKRVEDPLLWSAGFTMAVAYRLAAALSIAITENRSQHADLMQLYLRELQNAARMDGFQGRSEKVRSSVIATRRRW